jgi:hypothetical protein
VILFIKKNEDKIRGSIKASAPSSAEFLVEVIVTHSSKRWKGPCVYGCKMRHRKGC